MPKWKPHMTLSQRNAYNKHMRLYKLRRALREGRVPQARKDLTPEMMHEYRIGLVQEVVAFPQTWMDDKTRAGIKKDRNKIRSQIRDLLPAVYPRDKLERVIILLLSGVITIDDVKGLG